MSPSERVSGVRDHETAAAEQTGVPSELVAGYLSLLTDCLATGRRPRRGELDALRATGARAAEQSLPVQALVDAHLRVATLGWAALTRRKDGAVVELSAGSAAMDTVRRTISALLDGYASAEQLAYDRDESHRRAFVDDILHGRADLGRLADRAERLGVRLATFHVVAVVRPLEPPFPPTLAHQIDRGMSDRFGSHNVLVAERNDHLVCIAASGLVGIPGELSHLLVAALGAGVRWRIALGRSHAGPGGVVQSYEEALDALDLAHELGYTVPVLKADDLLVFRVLLRDRDAMVDLVDTVLGPLRNARGGPEPLLETLTALFEHQGNITGTARQLHLSARAVAYRLERVEQLTGYSPTEPTQRFTLEAAVLGARLLRWPNPTPP
jgi:sugar diacid utilization regulator